MTKLSKVIGKVGALENQTNHISTEKYWRGLSRNIDFIQIEPKLSHWRKCYGYLNGILAYFCRFFHDLLLIIVKSRDHGHQIWKFQFFQFKFHLSLS